ncbi:MAG: hypothetical protein MZV70_54595 [Desulfobacterales bacterium]|nr:hypothetical protein [Desulfobacterales bacterium]
MWVKVTAKIVCGWHLLCCNQMCDPAGEGVGFARTGTGQDQEPRSLLNDRLLLVLIEAIEAGAGLGTSFLLVLRS